jgi:hypothetical protein
MKAEIGGAKVKNVRFAKLDEFHRNFLILGG